MSTGGVYGSTGGTGGGASNRRNTSPALQVPQPFNPQTGRFEPIGQLPALPRLALFRIREIRAEYLVCEGYDPDLHGYMKEVHVARPYGLRDADPSYSDDPVLKVRYPDYDEEFEFTTSQKRTVTRYESDSETVVDTRSEEITPPYFVGDLIVAGRMRTLWGDATASPAVDDEGLQQTHEEVDYGPDRPYTILEDVDARPMFWVDLNVAGRIWFTDVTASWGWARVQSGGWTNGSGDTIRTFTVKLCDWDDTSGSSEAGDAFSVKTHYHPNKDTALFTGYVVRWEEQGDGERVITTDCWDLPIGREMYVDRNEAIRDGWCEDELARGRVLVGQDPRAVGVANPDCDTLDETGGGNWNDLKSHTHDDHTFPAGLDTCPGPGTTSAHSVENVLMPYVVKKLIKRFE